MKVKNINLKKGFFIFKNKNLKRIDREIEGLNNKYNIYSKIFQKEEIFKKNWFVDGKYVDLNKDYKNELYQIKQTYFDKYVEKCLQENQILLNYDFSKTDFDKQLLETIEKYQNKLLNNP